MLWATPQDGHTYSKVHIQKVFSQYSRSFSVHSTVLRVGKGNRYVPREYCKWLDGCGTERSEDDLASLKISGHTTWMLCGVRGLRTH